MLVVLILIFLTENLVLFSKYYIWSLKAARLNVLLKVLKNERIFETKNRIFAGWEVFAEIFTVFARGLMNANIFCTRVELFQKYSQEKNPPHRLSRFIARQICQKLLGAGKLWNRDRENRERLIGFKWHSPRHSAFTAGHFPTYLPNIVLCTNRQVRQYWMICRGPGFLPVL